IDARDAAYAVYVEQRGVAGSVHRPTNGADVARDPRRSRVVDDHATVDLVLLVSAHYVLDTARLRALTQFHVQHVDPQPVPPRRNGRAACAGGTLGPSGTVAWRHRNRSSRDRMAATGSSTRRASRRVRPGPPPDSRPPECGPAPSG